MPTLGAPLNFAQLEARNVAIHNLSTAPGSPVKGQMYFDTAANTLYWWDGTQWWSAKGITPPDATTTSKGMVQLAGDLSGTAAAPVVANGAITSAKILDGTITDVDVAAANKDGVVGTPSLRTLGSGAQQAMPGNRTIDVLSPAAGNVLMGGWRITNMGDPTLSTDAATKNYVDTVAQGLDAKQPVQCATTANITLSGLQAIDGYTTIAGDRVLVKNQTTQSQNGIYVAASGAWARAADNDSWAEMPAAYCWVEMGTTQADTGWLCTNDPGGTLNTTNVTWVQFSGAAMITAGVGLTKTGNTISALPDNSSLDTGGAGSSLEIKLGGIASGHMGAGSVDLTGATVTGALPVGKGGTGSATAPAARTTLGAAGYYNNNATHGAGTTITITQATHGLRSSRGIHVQVQDNTTGNVEIPDVTVAANGDVTVTYAASVAANSKLVTLVG